MKTKPARRYRQPAYPTRLEVLSKPELLRRHLPPGWRRIPEMAGTVALFLAVNSTVQAAEKKAGGAAPGTSAVVAPIFEHGDGRGASGCVMVAPPVFLSEEEAWQVIDEELGRQDLELPKSKVEVSGVKIAQHTQIFAETNGQPRAEETPGSQKTYQADRANAEKRIAVEFVSESDYQRLGGLITGGSKQFYDFKEVAKSVADTVGKDAKEKLYFGVLYDPTAKVERPTVSGSQQMSAEERQKQWADDLKNSKAESQRLLRLQVQDFIKWLQAQGAI